MRKTISLLIALMLTSAAAFAQTGNSPSSDHKKLVAYLKSHGMSPENYVVSKFRHHDIVFLGEYHRIKHDVELIHNLIPRLHKAGVYNLGIEFGCYEHQDKVDKLITAETYDENLARWLMFQSLVSWGFVEYDDLYRKAWELNKSLPKGARKFRVVNLGYRPNWPARKEDNEMRRADWDKVWWNGDPDEHMARVVIKEFVDTRQKALIYAGHNHAFTRYHQPIYDYQIKKLWRLNPERMGNLVYNKIGDRAFNIFLHAPWWGSAANQRDVLRPMHGVIDSVMEQFGNKRVGFDVRGTPFGAIPDDRSYFSLGYAKFTLDTFCDGYIFQRRLEDYEGVTIDPSFITEANFQEAIAYFPNPSYRKRIKSREDLFAGMRQSTSFKTHFKNLK